MTAEENQEKSFEALVREAPEAPAAGTISLVGTLARSGETGQFVLTLEDGSAVTLETAAVRGYAVLGASFGQTIVRVDLDARKIPAVQPNPRSWFHHDPNPLPWSRAAGGAVPFALATAQQAPLDLFERLSVGGLFWPGLSTWSDAVYTGLQDLIYSPYRTGPLGQDVSVS